MKIYLKKVPGRPWMQENKDQISHSVRLSCHRFLWPESPIVSLTTFKARTLGDMNIISRASKTLIWLGSNQLNAPRVGVVLIVFEMSADFENSLGSISLELLSPRCQLHRMVVTLSPPQKWPFVFKTTEPTTFHDYKGEFLWVFDHNQSIRRW